MTFKSVIFSLILVIILLKVPELLGVNELDQQFWKGMGAGIFCCLGAIKKN